MAKDPYKYFRIEARELVDGLKQGTLDLEKAPSVDAIALLLRLAHTLKGAARVVKLPAIAEGAHAMEDLLEAHRTTPAITRAVIDELLRVIDAAAAEVARLSIAEDAPRKTAALPAESVRVEVEELDRLISGLAEATARLHGLRAASNALERATLEGELANVRRALRTDVEQLGVELFQARDAAARLRLTPASHVFAMLEHAVRDAARTLRKDVRFVATGGETRLDAHVLGDVADALLHVVRNAVAHGVDVRGTVTVTVERSADTIVFACRDDGRGIDVAALRKLAIARGVGAERLANDEALLALLLEGGMTTTETVTDVSGRGVGLDVVRDVVSRLRGTARVTTRSGEGTTFELRVPVSLTSHESLMVSSAGITGSIPLDAVQATLRIEPRDVVRASGGDTFLFEGRAIPFVSLARALRVEGAPVREARSVVVIRAEGVLAAIGVEQLRGTTNAIIHRLPPDLAAGKIIAGASLDADGNPELAFDPRELADAAASAAPEVRVRKKPPRPVLVVDDSLTTRMLERSILESAGYEVDLATSAEDALEKANQRAYGVFVVDVEMPGIDGFTFVSHTRADPTLRDIPAILVTSRDSAEDKARGKAAGATAYIVKGEFDQAMLLQTIRDILG